MRKILFVSLVAVYFLFTAKPTPVEAKCTASLEINNTVVKTTVSGTSKGITYFLGIWNPKKNNWVERTDDQKAAGDGATLKFALDLRTYPDGNYRVIVKSGNLSEGDCLNQSINIKNHIVSILPAQPVQANLCPPALTKCLECITKGDSWTALGCLPTSSPQEFVAWLLRAVIGIAGGIAFLLIIFAGLQIITSAGDPQKLQAGKELLTSAIIGLIVIIFSLFLLQLIGVKILQIPGL